MVKMKQKHHSTLTHMIYVLPINHLCNLSLTSQWTSQIIVCEGLFHLGSSITSRWNVVPRVLLARENRGTCAPPYRSSVRHHWVSIRHRGLSNSPETAWMSDRSTRPCGHSQTSQTHTNILFRAFVVISVPSSGKCSLAQRPTSILVFKSYRKN